MRATFAGLTLWASLSPAFAFDLPNLWFPKEFTGAPATTTYLEKPVVQISVKH